jgi:PAS domain S-box-containing protein
MELHFDLNIKKMLLRGKKRKRVLISEDNREPSYLLQVLILSIIFSFFCIYTSLNFTMYRFLEVYSKIPIFAFFVNTILCLLVGLLWISYRFWRIALEKQKEAEDIISSISLDGVLVIDPDTNIIMCNRNIKNVFGYDVSEVVNQKIDFLCNPIKLKSWYDIHNKVIGDGSYIALAEGKKKNGQKIALQIMAGHLSNNKGFVLLLRDITKHKKTTKALQDSESKFTALAEHTPNMIFINKKGRVVYANKKCEEIMGYKKEEFYAPDFDFFNLIAPEYQDVVKENLERHINGEEISPYEYAIITREGKRIESIITTKLIDYEKEKAVLGIITDITKLKEAKESLRESEEKYRLLVENQTDLVVKVDLEGRFLFVSPSYCEMFGKTECELLGNKFIPLVHEEDRELTLKAMEALYKPPYTCYVEQRAMTKDGWKWLAWADKAVLDEQKNIIAIVGVGRDITKRKQAEEELSLTRSHLENILRSVPAVIYSYKPFGDHQITFISENVLNLLGYDPKVFFHDPKYWMKHIHPEDRSKALDEAKAVLKTGFCVFEYRFLHKNGTYRWLSDERKLVKDEKGDTIEVVGSFLDITDQKHLEEKFHHSQKMEAVGRLAGGIAHDFNNLLQTIMGYTDLMLLDYEDNKRNRKDIEEIQKASKRAASLTRQLLAFSRKQAIQPQMLDVNLLIDDMTEMIKRLIGEDIEFSTIEEPELRSIEADQGYIEQVIMNLTLNARDAMQSGGKLIITTENITLEGKDCKKTSYARPGDFVCLSVEDTGSGIEKETMEHIFEPFFSTKGKWEGTGLGLSTVYGIIQQHKGWINVYSEIGKGTTFKIFLPAFSLKPENMIIENKSLLNYKGNGEKILIIEDETGVRDFAKRALLDFGYVVFEATNIQDALDILEKEKWDFRLILSDVILPDGSGLSLINQIKLFNPEIKLIMNSGYTDQRSKLHIIQRNRINFIQKPYTLPDLLKAVKKTLKSSQVKQEEVGVPLSPK